MGAGEWICSLMLHFLDDRFTNLSIQEGWLAENAVSEDDKLAAEKAQAGANRPDDPMQGLEGLDVAGPKPA